MNCLEHGGIFGGVPFRQLPFEEKVRVAALHRARMADPETRHVHQVLQDWYSQRQQIKVVLVKWQSYRARKSTTVTSTS